MITVCELWDLGVLGLVFSRERQCWPPYISSITIFLLLSSCGFRLMAESHKSLCLSSLFIVLAFFLCFTNLLNLGSCHNSKNTSTDSGPIRWSVYCSLVCNCDLSHFVQIYVLLYKEVAIALKINSAYSKSRLLGIHDNVKVLRYPDHFSTGVYLWYDRNSTEFIFSSWFLCPISFDLVMMDFFISG